MSPRVRLVLFLLGAAGFLTTGVLAVLGAPPVGTDVHPYRDAAVAGALAHATANVVSTVNYDQRALDTLGEETILLASVTAAVALLRPADDERVDVPPPDVVRSRSPATRLAGWLLLPATLLVGLDVVLHGHLTPGGGFQGGVVLATAVHLLYLAGSFAALERLRPRRWAPVAEPVGALGFVGLGVAGSVAGVGFLGGVLPFGTLGDPLSSPTVILLNVAVGIGVGFGLVVLVAQFLRQEVLVR
ncbi:MnhB domain-containing protein [Actinomycetospora chiangmaiensis]|uniref:MnhB domain-containing protein n=1 Tax=Actinomycetospora chiangmaiensis TaxID=402650 RepID=UPI0003688EDA|nr:MnhB domain-containing protein [Actinomycetospora chiangmaiensis]